MTSVGRGAMQTPDEVLAALRARGAQISTPPSVKAAGSAGAARSTEDIDLFMRLGGAVCSIVRFADDGAHDEDAPPYVDGVIAVLPGGSFIAAFGPEALDPNEPRGVRRVVSSVVASANSLGGRGVIYTEPKDVDPSIFDVEVLSLRASVEPFVREALRAHAEGLTSAREGEGGGRLDPALARVVLTAGEDSGGLHDQELDAGEAIRSAMTAARRVVVLGDFGSGRSTELARRATLMAAAYLERRDVEPCPVLLPLRGMRPDLGAILREHVPGLSPDAFRLASSLGMVVSFFDGFDELDLRPGKAELAAALKALTSFAGGEKARLVISLSRSTALALPLHELLADEPGAPFSVVTLRGFGREGALRLPQKARAPKDEPEATRRAPDAPDDPSSRAAAATLEAMDRAKTFAIAMRDWIRSELSFRDDSPPQGAPDDLVERSLAAARRAARVLFSTDTEEASLGALTGAAAATAGADAAEGRRLVELILGAALFKVSPAPDGSSGDPRVAFAHRSFLEALVAQDIAQRLDEGSAGLDALDLPPLSPMIVGFLAGIDGWDRRKKRLRDALAQPYRPRVSENALLAIYGAARARLRGEALGKRLSDDLPPKMKLAGAKLAGARLAWASLPEADLTGADLSLADLSLADMRGARLDQAKADHAVFDGADLEWATCAQADFFSASFVNANVAGMKRSEANTEGALFIAARGDEGGFIKRGIDAPPDQAMGWFIESAPHMGQALALSPDGRWVAVGRGFTVAILDAKTGHVRLILPGSTGCALAVAFSPDGRWIVSAAKDGSIRVWDARRGALVRGAETEPCWAISLAFSPDSSTLISASDGGAIRIWDMPRCELIRVVPSHTSWFYAVAFSPAGDLFAAALADGSIRVWDAQKGALVAAIHASLGPYPCACFSADGALVFAPCSDGSVRGFSARSGEPRLVLTSARARESASEPLAQPASGEREPPSEKLALYMAVACSPDGRRVAAASSTGVALWDVRSPERSALVTLVEGSRDACSIAFSPSGSEVVFTLSDGSIRGASAEDGRLLRKLTKHARTVDCAVFSPSGDTIASASSGGSIRVWDARRGDLLHTLEGPAAMGTSIVFSLSGDTLAVVMADGSVQMWDARRGDLGSTLRAHDHSVVALAFSPDGDALASGALDGSIALWDTSGSGVVRHLLGGSGRVTSLAFSPSGDRLGAADVDGTIHLWDPRTGAPLGALAGHEDAVHSIAFLPDGDKLASASADGSIRLWDARSRATTHVVLSRGGPVHSVTFSPDGDKLASAYADGTVRLWDVAQGELIEVLEGHTASVSSASFSLDGEVLVTASADGTVRLWRVADGRCLCMMLAVEAGWITIAGDAPFFIGGGDVSALLRFTAGSSSMPAELWAPIFRRPDLVAKTLWGETPSADALGLSKVEACESALVDARARMGLGHSRRQGLTGVIAVSQSNAGRQGLRADDGPRTPSGPRPPMKRALTWLHLGDLHFGAALQAAPHRFDQAAVVSAIRRDVAQGSLQDPDFIFVTGDVAWSGQASEYEQAEEWLRSIAEAAGAPLDRVRVVPGNHDVDRARTNNKLVARAHSKLRAAPEELDSELADDAQRAAIADKLSAYAAFVRSALPGHPAPGPSGLDWWERAPAIPGKRGRTRLAGLSTVWVSDNSDGRLHKGQAVPFVRNMIVGPRQIERALGDIEDDELVIVLTHHPAEWLHRDSADELANALGKRPHIHLCSHLHDAPGAPDLKRFGAFGAKLRYVVGSAHGAPAESKKHGYSWGAVRWNSDARLWQAGAAPRIYDEARGQMRPDTPRHALDPDGFVWETLRIAWRSPGAVEVQG